MNRIASSVTLHGKLAAEILAAVTDTILILDAMGRLLFVSSATGDVLGHEPDYWIGRSALDLVHPDDLDAVLDRLKSAIATPAASRNYVPLRISSNGERWLPAEAHAFNPVDFDGTPGIVVSIRDSTGRLQFARARNMAARTLVLRNPAETIDNSDMITHHMLPSMFTDSSVDRQLLLVNISFRGFDKLAQAFGLARADNAVLALASVLDKVGRADDLVARRNDRELVVACPDITTAIQANLVAQRFFDACNDAQLVPSGFGMRAGCALTSIGDDLTEVLDFTATNDHFTNPVAS